jgi:hypothetical protein
MQNKIDIISIIFPANGMSASQRREDEVNISGGSDRVAT